MIKRKATVTLDEWLSQGTLYADVSRAGTIEPINPQVAATALDTEVTPLPEVTAVPSEDMVELANQDAAAWFWALLAQAGYELWWPAQSVN